MRPSLEVTITNAEDDHPVHEMVVHQLEDVIGARRPAATGYVAYVHTLAPDVHVGASSVQTSSLSYVGITKQGW